MCINKLHCYVWLYNYICALLHMFSKILYTLNMLKIDINYTFYKWKKRLKYVKNINLLQITIDHHMLNITEQQVTESYFKSDKNIDNLSSINIMILGLVTWQV